MENKSKEKILKERILLQKQKQTRFTWSDIKNHQFEDNDMIEISYDEGFVSENDSWDPCWRASIVRLTEESDSEYKKRQERIAQDEKWAKERRYESYLRLKKEFENEENKS